MGKLTAKSELEQIRAALDTSSIVVVTDKTGVITYVNRKFCEISGYAKEELIGNTHKMVNSGHHDLAFWQKLWQQISSGNTWSGIIKNRKKSGTYYWVETTIVPLLDDENKPALYVAIRKDITDRIDAEEELGQHRAKIIYSEKMAALGEMAAGIAHELGNPLGALRGRIEMLAMQSTDKQISRDEIKEFSSRATGIIDRMSLIIKGLQAYSRDGSKDPFISTDIILLINEVLEFSNSKLSKNGVHLIKIGLDDPIQVECREAEIGQIILNLISNACDAVKSLDQPEIEVRVDRSDTHIRIQVTDSGPGIPKKFLKNIFDPFFTTKDVGEGTGLGLSISKKIAQSHSGHLDIDTSKSSTCFVLDLPLLQDSKSSEAPES